MTRGSLKRETESLIIGAQVQALQTNYSKARIEKRTNDAKCRLCKTKDETVSHIASECSKIAQTEYKHRLMFMYRKIPTLPVGIEVKIRFNVIDCSAFL